MTRVEEWLAASVDDAGRRDLPELRPLLEGLARATASLRAARWNERALSRLESRPVPPGGTGPERNG